MFDSSVVLTAKSEFSHQNKLGQGRFGQVYKMIAVKRLSKKSGQGLKEFKDEIMIMAKLHHRNLVRLLGCCIHGKEKMLSYKYMPNKSLDSFLFDTAKQAQLDLGIARRLLYLHRDSRLRIIHRDLKGNNILLDEDMKPKISDFGMARVFKGNQNKANTNRAVTWLSNMQWKAWDLWDRGTMMELIDPSIASPCNQDQVRRCIHIAMLCVQDSANHRPNMATVVLMLETMLPLPRQPVITMALVLSCISHG